MSKKSRKEEVKEGVQEKPKVNNVVDFADVFKGSFNSIGSLTELVNQTVLIKDVEFRETRKGYVAIVTVIVNGKEERRHTFSQVIIDQLRALEELFKSGKMIRATVRKRGSYYTLA